jgi:3-carboxy-cis,cis-muconate cycloisomerase
MAEALSFALAEQMPRPQAQDIVREMCRSAVAGGTHLLTLAEARFPRGDWPPKLAGRLLGQAPSESLAFAARVRGV